VWRPLPSEARTSPTARGLLAEQGVGERGLAGPGGTDEHCGAARGRRHVVQALAGHGADGQDLDAGRREGELGHRAGHPVEPVGLGQHDHRRRPALPGQGEQALHAAGAPAGLAGDGDEHGVDVGGEHLGLGAPRDGGAHQGGAAGQDGGHGRGPARITAWFTAEIDEHPVPHRGRDGAAGAHAAAVGEDVDAAAVDAGDAAGQPAWPVVRVGELVPRVVPAVAGQDRRGLGR
jgi:hypothetical protein